MSNPDSLAKIWADAKAQAAESARKVAGVVAPHLTLDNAIKVATLANTVLDAATKVRSLRPTPPPAPTRRNP